VMSSSHHLSRMQMEDRSKQDIASRLFVLLTEAANLCRSLLQLFAVVDPDNMLVLVCTA